MQPVLLHSMYDAVFLDSSSGPWVVAPWASTVLTRSGRVTAPLDSGRAVVECADPLPIEAYSLTETSGHRKSLGYIRSYSPHWSTRSFSLRPLALRPPSET